MLAECRPGALCNRLTSRGVTDRDMSCTLTCVYIRTFVVYGAYVFMHVMICNMCMTLFTVHIAVHTYRHELMSLVVYVFHVLQLLL